MTPEAQAKFSPGEMAYLEALGNRIRNFRRAHKIGLETLAERADVHRTHLWKIEKGQLNAGILVFVRLAVELEVPLSELLPALDDESRRTDGL